MEQVPIFTKVWMTRICQDFMVTEVIHLPPHHLLLMEVKVTMVVPMGVLWFLSP
jgi:hypothetical protein